MHVRMWTKAYKLIYYNSKPGTIMSVDEKKLAQQQMGSKLFLIPTCINVPVKYKLFQYLESFQLDGARQKCEKLDHFFFIAC